MGAWGNCQTPESCAKQRANHRWYHHIEVKPQTIGRVLGIGVRLTGRVAGQVVNAGIQAATTPAAGSADGGGTAGGAQLRGRAAGKASRGLARGVGGFLRPFQRVGGILWLEVTGVFFLLPVVVFGPTLWRTRVSYLHGPDHRTFLVTAGVVVVFLYLSVSSFWRARRK
jgi:hypothetical protein